MTELVRWLLEESHRAIETLAIVIGLFYTAFAFRADARSRQIQNLISITESYRELWSQLHHNPELARVVSPEADLERQPVTVSEDRFVRFLVNHLNVVFRASRVGFFTKPEHLHEDVRQFFSLPIPRAVWKRVKPFQDHSFRAFVDQCVISNRRRPEFNNTS